MSEQKNLLSSTVAILGLGLMGGSMAMRLRGRCARLLGVDPDPSICAMASRMKIVDRVSQSPKGLIPDANLIILAAPVRDILSLLDELPELHPGNAVVIDLGSTKVHVLEAMQRLPHRFTPLGGHPMCGKENVSLTNAEASLYQGTVFALVRLARTSAYACSLAEELVSALEAESLWLDAETHDQWAASTSHLPYLTANALAYCLSPDSKPLVGSGLLSTTRLAPTPLTVMMDILVTNRENILASLHTFQAHLNELEASLKESDWETLSNFLSEGAQRHKHILSEDG